MAKAKVERSGFIATGNAYRMSFVPCLAAKNLVLPVGKRHILINIKVVPTAIPVLESRAVVGAAVIALVLVHDEIVWVQHIQLVGNLPHAGIGIVRYTGFHFTSAFGSDHHYAICGPCTIYSSSRSIFQYINGLDFLWR